MSASTSAWAVRLLLLLNGRSVNARAEIGTDRPTDEGWGGEVLFYTHTQSGVDLFSLWSLVLHQLETTTTTCNCCRAQLRSIRTSFDSLLCVCCVGPRIKSSHHHPPEGWGEEKKSPLPKKKKKKRFHAALHRFPKASPNTTTSSSRIFFSFFFPLGSGVLFFPYLRPRWIVCLSNLSLGWR